MYNVTSLTPLLPTPAFQHLHVIKRGGGRGWGRARGEVGRAGSRYAVPHCAWCGDGQRRRARVGKSSRTHRATCSDFFLVAKIMASLVSRETHIKHRCW